MKKWKVIKLTSIQTKPPVIPTIVWWLFLDRINAPGWAYGAIGVMFVIAWLAFFICAWRQEPTNLPGFGEEK